MNTDEFLKAVVTTPGGYFLLATRNGGDWNEHWFDWPACSHDVLTTALRAVELQHDVYFSAHLFGEKRSLKAAVLPSRTIQADLDYADVMTLPVLPTVLVSTSPQRHQGYWVMDSEHAPVEIETIGRRIAYGVRDCDRTGWTAGHRMRLPGTYNFKYLNPALVDVVVHHFRSLDPEAFNLFPTLATSVEVAERDAQWIMEDPCTIDVGPQQLMADAKFNTKISSAYSKVAADRSAWLWGLMMEGFRCGLNRDQVYWLAWNTPNNKFLDERRHSGVSDLRKDVLRAETVALDRSLDLRAAIMDLRISKKGHIVYRQQQMAHIVVKRMREEGELIHARGGQLFFLRKDTGRPIEISERSLQLEAYLTKTFGLNGVEAHTRFVKRELMAHTRNMAASVDLSALSYYDIPTNTLLLHTGGRNVLHIRAGDIETHPNGYGHAVFNVDDNIEPFRLGKLGDLGGKTWYDFIFGPQMDHIDGSLTKEEAVVLLRAWFLLLIFRSNVSNRPLLGFIGQPGAGKTTTAKKLLRLLYGPYRSLNVIESPERFDIATIKLPFVCFDGVDTYERWLPDRLSQAAANTDVVQRMLYTDTDTITQRRQAMIMLTAHNPKFTREDVVDRMILIMLRRLPHWESEDLLLNEVSEMRGALWADIVRDVQNVLATPRNAGGEPPQFRIEDYAHYGMWFAEAAGQTRTFVSAINKLIGTQRGVNLETDQLLVQTISRWLQLEVRHGREPRFVSQGTLWSEMATVADDPIVFQRVYRNALYFGRKLQTMQDSLRSVYDVEVQYNSGTGVREWKFAPKS